MDDLLKQLEEAKIVNEIAAMDDDVTLSAELAAVFLRSSPQKLASLGEAKRNSTWADFSTAHKGSNHEHALRTTLQIRHR